MKMILIRHGKPDFRWEKRYTAEEFARACEAYEQCGIRETDVKPVDASRYRVFSGRSKRALQTAEALFAPGMMVSTDLLGEVPMAPALKTERALPCFLWMALARIQWFFPDSPQPENRARTVERARKAIQLMEGCGQEQVIAVSHGFFLRVLAGELRKRGYLVEGGSPAGIPCLGRLRATKREDHCGGCLHNCLLSNPGCDIGRDRARRWSGPGTL